MPADDQTEGQADTRISGTIKFVAPHGRFAMIARDDRLPKVFVHLAEARQIGLSALTMGQRLSFRLQREPDGRAKATDLSLL
ncbi:MAG: cold-shock protein [Brevundimonas sp.]|uniref:cold-shock protein n=1 Tax=Brevundimonas sp. TaxID=1871086 RepID=UPI00391DA6F2